MTRYLQELTKQYLDIDTLIRLHSDNQLIPHSATIEYVPRNILVLNPHL